MGEEWDPATARNLQTRNPKDDKKEDEADEGGKKYDSASARNL